jgi:hypothetical protein
VKDKQIGGSHYLRCAITPWEIIERNELCFFSGNVVKYLLRYKMKGGVEDLLKAQHYIEKLINIEEKRVQNRPQERFSSEVFDHLVSNLRSSTSSATPVNAETDGWVEALYSRSNGTHVR